MIASPAEGFDRHRIQVVEMCPCLERRLDDEATLREHDPVHDPAMKYDPCDYFFLWIVPRKSNNVTTHVGTGQSRLRGPRPSRESDFVADAAANSVELWHQRHPRSILRGEVIQPDLG